MNKEITTSKTSIEWVPQLPPEIKEAVDRKRLAVFVGAGVSRIIGCKGWDSLALELAQLCHDKRYVTFKEKDALTEYSRSGDHKKTISICKHVLEEKNDADAFYSRLETALQSDPERRETFPIYSELYRFRAVFVTTNMDCHFDELFTQSSIAYKSRDFAIDPSKPIDPTRLYHLHGTIRDRSSLVLTVADYFSRYHDDNIQNFLKRLFTDYRVLFVGYGLSEFELLDYLMIKHSSQSPKERRHFYLMPLFSGEDNILAFEQSYFGDMGIKVLAYRKDERGYDQLFYVISHWQEEINQVSSYLYDSYALIEDLAAAYDPAREETLFQLIRNDPPQENHFFRIASSPGWLIPLRKRGYFAPDKNPRPVESQESPGYYRIPYWNALDYLEKVALQVARLCDEAIGNALMDIVRSVSDYQDDKGKRIDNYHTDSAFVKIMAALPIEFLEVQDMDRIGIYLRSQWGSDLVAAEIGASLLPKLLNEQAIPLAGRLLNIVIDCEVRERNGEKEFAPLTDDYWLNELMENNKAVIGALLPLKAAGIVLDKIEQIVSADKRQFNAIWIPAVEDHPQNRFPTRYQNILVRAARYFLDSAADKEPEKTQALVEDLLDNEHPIFPRIALHVISTHWANYSDLFWPLLKSELLTNVFLKHELYELFRNNHTRFSETQLDNVLHWIEAREYWTPEGGFEDEEQERRYVAFQKLEWLTALKESNYQKAIDKYERYLALAGQEPEHPGFSVWMGDVQVGSISPIEVADLLQKDSKEIARYLIEYRDEGDWHGKPSREGLADAFKTAVTNEPQKFSADLSPFLELPPYYLFYLLWAFKDACDAKRDFDWEAVLSFCLDLVRTDAFWVGPSKKDRLYPGSLVSQVADLIEVGTKDDSHAFSPTLLPLAEELLLILMAKAESVLSQGPNLVTAVLNSPKGGVFAATINYSLRYARLRRDEEPTARWAPAIKEEFTRRLDRSFDPSIEFSVTLGEYIANLAYLDRNWLTTHINEIFPKDNETHWRAAMTGYFWLGRLYRDLYEILRSKGHYAKALATDFEDPHVRERVIQHLTIAFLWGVEELADPESLFTRLVTACNPDDLGKIVSYLWMQRDALSTDQRTTVLSLWRHLFAHYHDRGELDDDEANLVSDLSKFAVYLDTIDPESLRWLLFSAPCVERNHNTWFFVECLDRLVSVSPHEVGLIYIEMLQNGIYPDYDQAHITHTVETLYAEGEKGLADRICIYYGRRGYHFLRRLYEQYRDVESGEISIGII